MDDTKQYIKSYFSERGIDLTDKQIETIENMLIIAVMSRWPVDIETIYNLITSPIPKKQS